MGVNEGKAGIVAHAAAIVASRIPTTLRRLARVVVLDAIKVGGAAVLLHKFLFRFLF
jgi:hypothetical protein